MDRRLDHPEAPAATEAAREFAFDATCPRPPRHARPANGLRLDARCWVEAAKRHVQGRPVALLEGGYNLGALARSVAAHLGLLSGLAARQDNP